jgi:hypothetical protein
MHGCLSLVSVVCWEIQVSATCWSLVQRSPTKCNACLSVIVKPQEWGGPGPSRAIAPVGGGGELVATSTESSNVEMRIINFKKLSVSTLQIWIRTSMKVFQYTTYVCLTLQTIQSLSVLSPWLNRYLWHPCFIHNSLHILKRPSGCQEKQKLPLTAATTRRSCTPSAEAWQHQCQDCTGHSSQPDRVYLTYNTTLL